MPEKTNHPKLILLEPVAYSIEEAAFVSAEGVTSVRDALRLGELANVVKGTGENRQHKTVLRSDLLDWLHSKRVPATRHASTTNDFPKSASGAD